MFLILKLAFGSQIWFKTKTFKHHKNIDKFRRYFFNYIDKYLVLRYNAVTNLV